MKYTHCIIFHLATSGGFHDSFPRISSRRLVHQKESFRSFSRVSGSGESFSESFVRSFSRVSDSGESFSESFSFANRECQPSRFRLTSALRPSFSFANASRVGQTHFLPRSQHSNESRFTIVQWCKWLSINTTLTKLI